MSSQCMKTNRPWPVCFHAMTHHLLKPLHASLRLTRSNLSSFSYIMKNKCTNRGSSSTLTTVVKRQKNDGKATTKRSFYEAFRGRFLAAENERKPTPFNDVNGTFFFVVNKTFISQSWNVVYLIILSIF